ncbi:hypothetical protein ACHQM5_003845 [Ranunculus cassubicifolius]
MKLLAEKFFQYTVKHIGDSLELSPRHKALIHCLQAPYAQSYLLAVPIQGTGQKIEPRTFRSIIGYRLGIPFFINNPVCPSCKLERMDEFGDHALHCAAEIGVKHRHDQVRDLIFDLCRCAGVPSRKEVPLHCISEDGGNLRPADILLTCWEQGRDVCMDITGVSPFVSSGFNTFVPGQAVLKAAQRKVSKYGAKCTANGLGFLPFAFTTFGELCEEAVEFLKRIRLATLSNAAYAKSAPHIFNRVGIFIQKGVGAQIVSRLPTNFL